MMEDEIWGSKVDMFDEVFWLLFKDMGWDSNPVGLVEWLKLSSEVDEYKQ